MAETGIELSAVEPHRTGSELGDPSPVDVNEGEHSGHVGAGTTQDVEDNGGGGFEEPRVSPRVVKNGKSSNYLCQKAKICSGYMIVCMTWAMVSGYAFYPPL